MKNLTHASFSRSVFFCALLTLWLMQSACLKTRAQLKSETEGEVQNNSSQPVNQGGVETAGNAQVANNQVIDELKNEITHLTGRIEELERNQKPSPTPGDKDPNVEKIKQLETRIAELEQAQAHMIESLKKNEAEVQTAASGDLFEKGKKQFEQSNYQGAIDTLSVLLKNPKAKHIQEATFIRGESFFALQDYKKAILDYSKFPEKFNDSKRMPAALYKIGLSFEALGMKDDAKGFYQELVEKFPKSVEAKKARSKIK